MTLHAEKLITADELIEMSGNRRCELIKGEVIDMAPAGGGHGSVTGHFFARIYGFVHSRGLGEVFAAETGFVLEKNPDTVRAPDVAFVTKKQLLATGGIPTRGFMHVAPALVVEVLSPGDRASDVEEKTQQWLAFGVTSVWLADPRTKSVTIHRTAGVSRFSR
jgi:Uma2 family endonuclease